MKLIFENKFRLCNILFFISLLLFSLAYGADGSQQYELSISTSEIETDISPELYGIFFEDINHAVDGGIYAELVYNRSFEHSDNLEAWTIDKKEDIADAEIRSETPLTEENPNYLQVTNDSATEEVTVSNSGHGGIYLEEGKEYNLSIYANTSDFNSKIEVLLINEKQEILAETEIELTDSGWQEYNASLLANKTSENGELLISINDPGQIKLGFISLFPEDTWQGRENGLRKDLVKKLVDLNPKFLRFPGGCLAGGLDLDNAYRWKDTVGDITKRPTEANIWGYYQSHGVGFHEYFLLAEDLDAEPTPILNAGMSDMIIPRNPEVVPLEDMDEWIQDALDLIEYANGPVDSKWGAKRAEHGHPEPFGLKYLGIGNEHWGEDYFERFKMFKEAIETAHPEIELILSGGTQPDDQILQEAWDFGRDIEVDIVEEHMYRSPEWFLRNTERYDNYEDRGEPKVFVGEYAAHPEGQSNNLKAALAEAAFMTGMERNSDLVIKSSYAPLFNKVGHSQWEPDLIWFNNTQSFGTPSYYVQKMFSQNQGDVVLKSELSKQQDLEPEISGKVGLGSWATNVEYDKLKVFRGSEVLLEEDFTADKTDGISHQGDWEQKETTLQQNGLAEPAQMHFGDVDWDNYTIEIRARKLSGNEGMLIPFGVEDEDNYYWWNIGGWGNTQTGIEKEIGGDKILVGEIKSLSVEAGKWYDIKIEVSGNQIKAYLDDNLIHEIIDKQQRKPLYHVSSYDEETETLILKVVNAEAKNKEAIIDFSGQREVSHLKEVEVLQGNSLLSENYFALPENIIPEKKRIEKIITDQTRIKHEFPQYSLSILKFKIQ